MEPFYLISNQPLLTKFQFIKKRKRLKTNPLYVESKPGYLSIEPITLAEKAFKASLASIPPLTLA
jgi:hypothetical protein